MRRGRKARPSVRMGTILGLLMATAVVAPVGATTYVLGSDEALLDQATHVAEVVILKGVSPAAPGRPVTDYFAVVQRVIKGRIGKADIVVRLPGGLTEEAGLELHIDGVPKFRAGEEALLFLVENEDGTFSVLHWALGAFRKRQVDGEVIASRDMGDAVVLTVPSETSLVSAPEQEDLLLVRAFEGFVAWLEDQTLGFSREPDYFVALSSDSYSASWRLITHEGKNIRWFTFDSGDKVKFRFHSADSMRSRLQFKKALKAWNADEETPIRFKYGRTKSQAGHQHSDGKSSIIFGDPNDLMPGAFDCLEGGVVATSAPWLDTSETRNFDGEAFYRITEADIVVNNGVECLLAGNPTGAAETLARELGHTLGIDHSKNKNALMYSELHNDGRGAKLTLDDRKALRRLYKDDGHGSDDDPPGNPPPGNPPPGNDPPDDDPPDDPPCTPRNRCCKICTTGKACGNSCISRSLTCRQPPGCACNASAVC